jgi:hypothetical protein
VWARAYIAAIYGGSTLAQMLSTPGDGIPTVGGPLHAVTFDRAGEMIEYLIGEQRVEVVMPAGAPG